MSTSPCKSSNFSAEQQTYCYHRYGCNTLHWLCIAAQQAYLPADPTTLLCIASLCAFDHNSFSLGVMLKDC